MSVARAEDRAPWRHAPSAYPGAKTEGWRHDAALSFPFGIGPKAANRSNLFPCALYLISQPRFLHFTLNQHNPNLPLPRKPHEYRGPSTESVLQAHGYEPREYLEYQDTATNPLG